MAASIHSAVFTAQWQFVSGKPDFGKPYNSERFLQCNCFAVRLARHRFMTEKQEAYRHRDRPNCRCVPPAKQDGYIEIEPLERHQRGESFAPYTFQLAGGAHLRFAPSPDVLSLA